MTPVIHSLGRPTETTLQGETIKQVEFSPHDYSCSAFSRFLYIKAAIIKTEILIIFAKHHWKHSFFQLIRSFSLIVTIHKYVSLRGVPMKITKEHDLSAFQSLSHH